MGLSLPKSNLIFLKKCLDKWVHFSTSSDSYLSDSFDRDFPWLQYFLSGNSSAQWFCWTAARYPGLYQQQRHDAIYRTALHDSGWVDCNT